MPVTPVVGMSLPPTARPGTSDAPSGLRGVADALPHASIGTVPILWLNTAATDPRYPSDAATILDEIARIGYEGTQFGAGFPEGTALGRELADRGLRLAEVYLPIPATVDGPTADAMDVATECLRILHDAGGDVLCAAVDGSPDRERIAGRADEPGSPAFTDEGWAALADLLHEVADAATALGHVTVFHPHAATYVETRAEIDRLLAVTDRDRVGLCLDVGHHIVGGGDPVADTRRYGERVRHVHLKDVDPAVLADLRGGAFAGCEEAVGHGLFTELGAGTLDLDGVLEALAARDYAGWLMVEQDRCAGPPSESAAIGRRVLAASLRRLGRSGQRAVAS